MFRTRSRARARTAPTAGGSADTYHYTRIAGGWYITLGGAYWVRITTPAPLLGTNFTLGVSTIY